MKLQVAHESFSLDMNLKVEGKKKAVDELLEKKLIFHNESMTVEEYFRETWFDPDTIKCMDTLGYYLSKQDGNSEVLSGDKQKEMSKGSKKYTTFSGLDYKEQLILGLAEINDWSS
ncbi:hypothetical protein [Sporosarcina aquimarina]|uniref:hypothetical protein n=1 Tax=Sporosarcina aquimarina TaxID=114975 RepID=UPI001C8EA51A|nr:hypothetical protein [Sporosarcina aquimarina]MBY0221966.1 hypothetical protein [Sporosarcina aquimarina]